MSTETWYQELIRPSWAPPAWVFGPAWTVLYILIAISFGVVLYKVWTRELPWIVAVPFVLNLVFNFSFSYIQFGLQNNQLAAVDILLVLGTLIWGLVLIYQQVPSLAFSLQTLSWVIYANIPYLLWVSFATVLQLTITYLNR